MTEKEIFEVVKYFKNIYTTINMKDEIYLVGQDSGAFIYYKDEPYFLLYGKLVDDENNLFLKWIKGKKVALKLKDINNLRECLKKNVIDITSDDSEFILKYKDKEENEVLFVCKNKSNPIYEKIIEKIEVIESHLTKNLDIRKELLESDVLELYLDTDNKFLTEEKSSNKLIEIPSKRIMSDQKNANRHIIRFSEKDESGRRYVEVSSFSDLINLSQIYATI
jgi:hypothetical protein